MNTTHRNIGLVLLLLCALIFTTPLMAQPAEPIRPGQVVSGEIAAGERDNYTIEAQQGDVLSVTLSSEDFDAYLYILNADGERLTFNDDGPNMGFNAMIRGFSVPEDGLYIIQAASFADAGAGAYVLRADLLQLPTLQPNTPQTVNFNTDIQSFTFAFEGAFGQVIDVVVDSGNALNSKIEVLNPLSFPVYESIPASDSTDPALRGISLDADGTYLVVLSALDPRNVLLGEASILIQASELASLDDGPVTMDFDLTLNQHIVTFEGVAGELIQLQVMMTAGVNATLPAFMLMQDNQPFAEFLMNNLDEVLVRLVTPADGPVTMIVNAYSDSSLTVTLERNR